MSPKLSFRLLAGEELAQAEEQWAWASVEEKCRSWAVASCRLARGHDWYLDINPYEGAVYLDCRWCPAGIDDIYPDGIDLLNGDFEVYPGYVLSLQSVNGIAVNGQPCDGMFTYGWHGPVTVRLTVEKYTSMDWIGYEYNAWIEVDPV